MRPQKVVLLVLGSIAALLGLALTAAGGVLVGIHATQRDDDGYYSSSTERFETPTYALTSEDVQLHVDADGRDWGPLRDIGTARIEAQARMGAPVFIGIARHDDVERFLAASAHDELTDVSFDPFEPTYRRQAGDVPPAAPGGQGFWVASATGAGRQILTWDIESGDWDVVVMNADASRGVAVDASVGIKTGLLLPIGIGLLAGGLAAGGAAAVLIVVALRKEDLGHGAVLPPAQDGTAMAA
ncbi:MAG TPA: hypothetical protein VFK43_12950 [Acidimicrobiales bacterium]|nr:hypothetical protein [Acidimicrobiales bacterium]